MIPKRFALGYETVPRWARRRRHAALVRSTEEDLLQLSKFNYYGDFVVYPAAIVALDYVSLAHGGGVEIGHWCLAAAVGLATWTLLEYGLHRFAFHGAGPFVRLHAMHHVSPRALVGTPTWLGASILGGAIFVPLWWLLGFHLATGAMTGFVAGYLWYLTVHHVVHHRRPRVLARVTGDQRRRHAVHHYSVRPGNFGVTSAFWDAAFGTALPRPSLERTDRRRFVARDHV